MPGTQILRLQTLGRCRPFFVSILGDDYGETVATVDPALADFYPFLRGRRNISLIDMELSLARQSQAEAESPAGLAYIVAAPLRGINEARPRGQREMTAAKDAVRASRLRTIECQSQQAVLTQMAQDLIAAIDYEFPSLTNIRKLSSIDVARGVHAGFLRCEAEATSEVSRAAIHQTLTAYVASRRPGLAPILLASEVRHVGVTRLLTSWLASCKALRRTPEEGLFVFTHFAGLTAETQTVAAVVSRLTRSLREFLKENLNRDPVDVAANILELPALLQTLQQAGLSAVIVIDGLTSAAAAAEGSEPLSWLPVLLPEGVKVVLSVGTDAGLHFEARKRHWETITVPVLTLEEASAVCGGLQRRPGGKLADDAVRLLLMAAEAKPNTRANPLFLGLAAALVRDPHRRVPVETIIQAESVGELYLLVLDALLARDPESHPRMTADVLSLMYFSLYGLTMLEILHVLGVPRSLFDAHFGSFGQVLFQPLDSERCDPPESRRFVLMNPELCEAVQRRFMADHHVGQEVRLRVIEQYEGFIGPGRLTSLPTLEELITCTKDGDFARNADELAHALVREDAMEHVATLLGNLAVVQVLWASDLRASLFRTWTKLKAHVDPVDLYWDPVIDLYWTASATDASGRVNASRVLPLARLTSDLGELLLLLENPGADKFLALSIELYKKFFGSDQHPDVARVYYMLGVTLQATKDKAAECIEAFENSYNVYAKTTGNHIAAADAVISLGEVLIMNGRNPEALEALRLAKKMLEDLGVADFHPEASRCYNNLGLLAKKTGQLTAAEAYYAKALAIRRESYGEEHPHTALSYRNIGSLAFAMGKKQDAVKFFKKALDIGNTVYGPIHPTNATTHEWLGGILQDMGIETEGKVHAATAAFIREKVKALGDHARSTAAARTDRLNASNPIHDNAPRPI